MITAAVHKIPEPLVEQLAEGGLLVGPVGHTHVQELVACEKRANKMIERVICSCRFVKLFGKYAFEQ
jgi:protein-L-isoaspartate(D-aspartate) O-methyltransferase